LTEQEIQHELKEVLNGVTSMVIAHRMPTVWGADKIVVMNNGSKETEGTHIDLMKNAGGTYHQMVKLQTVHATH
jgi:ATP-binding cassette subfamily B protein